jgi:hypothetical protein
MIVRYTGDAVQLITQPDHAALAGRIMEHCADVVVSPRCASILHAIAEHDNGWQEPDSMPAIDPATGRAIDFVNAPAQVRQSVWPRGVARLRGDPWAAALVAQHAVAVYDRYRPDAEWAGFFAAMESSRDELLRGMERSLDELLHDYVFVRLGDLISLTFCTGWTDEHHVGGWSVHLDGSDVIVSPDPFDVREIAFDVPARELPRQSFESDDALRAALRAAQPTLLRGHAAGR